MSETRTPAGAEGEVQLPAGTPAVETGAAATETPAVEGGTGQEPPAASPSNPPWFTRRIDALTAKLREEERQHASTKQALTLARAAHDALSSEVARLRAGSIGGGQQAGAGPEAQAQRAAPASYSDADVDALAERRAAEMLAAQAARNAENESAERGKKEYADFVETVGNIRNLGGIPPETLQMAVDTGAAEHILYALGKNLDKAQEIFDMPPGKQAVELAKLANKPSPKAPDASKTPAPMTLVNGRSATATKDLADNNLSMAEWDKVRQEQIAARKAAGRR